MIWVHSKREYGQITSQLYKQEQKKNKGGKRKGGLKMQFQSNIQEAADLLMTVENKNSSSYSPIIWCLLLTDGRERRESFSFTVHMTLLTATGTFGLGRRC